MKLIDIFFSCYFKVSWCVIYLRLIVCECAMFSMLMIAIVDVCVELFRKESEWEEESKLMEYNKFGVDLPLSLSLFSPPPKVQFSSSSKKISKRKREWEPTTWVEMSHVFFVDSTSECDLFSGPSLTSWLSPPSLLNSLFSACHISLKIILELPLMSVLKLVEVCVWVSEFVRL